MSLAAPSAQPILMSGKVFACPRCKALLPAAHARPGVALQCAECGARFMLGKRSAGGAKPAPSANSEPDSYQLAEPECRFTDEELAPLPKPPAESTASDDQSTDNLVANLPPSDRPGGRRTEAAPPTWTFFSGVFTFPFRAEVRARWALMSMFGVVAAELSLLALRLTGLSSGGAVGFETIVGIMSGLPAIFLDLLVLGYASASLLAIVEDTGNGADNIEEWPEADWREWMLTLRFPIGAGLGAYLVAYGTRQLCGEWNEWAAVAALVAFPLLLISMLEGESPFMPISLPVWRASLGLRGFAGWFMFYAETTLVLAPLTAIVFVLAPKSVGGTLLIATPLATATLIIYFRLLGRLFEYIAVRTAGEAEE